MMEASRPATAEDLKRVVQALNDAGAQYDEITVDLLFAPGAQTCEMLRPHEQVVDLDGVQVRTVSLEGLLLTKQSQRPRDVQDRLILRRAIEELQRR